MNIINFNSGLLTLGEVGDLLMINSTQSVKNWLRSKNISINKFSKANYVYEVEVVCEIQKQLAINLRRNYPLKWKDMYKLMAPNDSIYELVLIQLGEEVVYKPLIKVKTKGEKDEKLLKELLSL
ncbi:MAG: hypothetical protein ACOYOR_06600 [Flavobacterium psychrophilum]